MRLAILALAAFVLTACHPDQKSATGDTAPPADDERRTVASSNPERAPAVGPADDAPAEGIAIGGVTIAPDFEYTLRYDRIRKTAKTKRDQRQILVEAEVEDGSEAMAKVVAALESAGYTAGAEKQQYGGARVRFRRQGHPDIYALVRESGSGPTIRNSNANATVYLTQML